jgi:hypothetical protein
LGSPTDAAKRAVVVGSPKGRKWRYRACVTGDRSMLKKGAILSVLFGDGRQGYSSAAAAAW